jgi:hypothetical protein
MAQQSPQLVIRQAMPPRQRWLLVALGVTILIGAYGAFEYGRSRAGFDFFHAGSEIREREQRIDALEAQIRELRTQLAAGETERVSLTRERAEVARTIGELQAQVSRQTQELAFYRGIVAQQGNNAEDIKVQRVTVEPGAGAGVYRLKLSLVRRVQTESLVNGVVAIHVDGQQQGRAIRLDLKQMTRGKASDLPYSFRYVENLDTELALPVDFQAERVTVEVKSSRRGVDPVIQTVVWDPQPA